ncbi:MAG: type II/IV secretion system protein [Desulfobacter sp.]|nr:MAG: type II/IV secretion system protein [Desulfobacter sp.]
MPVSETALIDAGVKVGLVPDGDLSGLRLRAKRERLKLLEVVTRENRFPETALYQALADTRNLAFFHPRDLVADAEAAGLLPHTLMLKRLMLPVKRQGDEPVLVLSDPDDRLSLDRVRQATGRHWKIGLSDPESLKSAIARFRETQLASSGRGAAPAAAGAGGTADPVTLLDDIMKEVYLRRVTDVHFEPEEDGMRVRLRVDGQMEAFQRSLTKADEEALLNRVKVLSGLDIAEQRMAQDGAMKYKIMGWDLPETDIRVATIPTKWGERCTMRILGQDTGDLTLSQLGMPNHMLAAFKKAIASPHGMILVTGPTGSGKSTTLYAGIRELDVGQLNVLTAEDPVEQTIDGVSQVQVSTKVSFAQALRSFLRHDPDVILVGEIRDRETVEIGLRAAMTGHLVLSTLHTNDSVGAVTRLADVGAERFLIGSTLIGVLAQRLARRLCPRCRKKRAATLEELEILGLDQGRGVELYEPDGCSFCLGSGYKGRIGLFEALWIGKGLAETIAQGAGEREIRGKATRFTSLWEDCRAKVLNGDAALADLLHYRPEEG